MNGAVVVPTYGRAELLGTCLASLAALDPAPALVVVVDGNDAPVPLGTAVPDRLQVVREPNRGPSHARNTGYEAARDAGADIVVFIDDDAIAPPAWFGLHMAAHERLPRAGAIGGGTTNLHPESVVAEYAQRVLFSPVGPPGPVRMVPSVNVSFKVACLDEAGLFPEDMRKPGGEDVELCWRVWQAGWEVHHVPGMEVAHDFHTSWRAFMRQQRAYGHGFTNSRQRWPEMPGADLLTKPWPRAVVGTVPHLLREGRRTGREHGLRLVPVSVVREAVFRTGALAERRRLERSAQSADQ